MLKRLSYFIIAILVLNMFFKTNIQAQSHTMYFMDRVPQYQEFNPAFQPKSNFFIGMPFFSSFEYNVGNSSIAASDIFTYNESVGSLITFMHRNGDKDKFISGLQEKNSLFFNLQNDILYFGFRMGQSYLTFSLMQKTDISFSYPRDFMAFLIKAVDTTTNYNFKHFDLNMLSYTELALGYSKSFDMGLTFGLKGKFLVGTANVSTQNNEMNFNVTVEDGLFPWHLNSDVTLNVYNPYYYIPTDSANKPDFDNGEEREMDEIVDSYKKISNHMGFAGDFGVTYSGINMLNFSASVIDFGYINWKKDVYNFKLQGDYVFNGIDDLSTDSLDNLTDIILDSIKNSFTAQQSNNNYRTWLPLKFYAGVEFSPVKFFSLGVMAGYRYFNEYLTQQYVVSANLKPFRKAAFSFSYSILDNRFSSIGAGMNLNLGLFSTYFIYDYIPLKYSKDFIPYEAKSYNFRMGLNFAFGYTQKRKMKDKPLIYE